MFSVQMWNCYETTKHRFPKSNNSIKGKQTLFNNLQSRIFHELYLIVLGCNRGFNFLLVSCNPTIWKFIEALQNQQT